MVLYKIAQSTHSHTRTLTHSLWLKSHAKHSKHLSLDTKNGGRKSQLAFATGKAELFACHVHTYIRTYMSYICYIHIKYMHVFTGVTYVHVCDYNKYIHIYCIFKKKSLLLIRLLCAQLRVNFSVIFAQRLLF